MAKDAMEQRGTPYVEEEGNVKAGFVELESGERAWVVMLDSAYHADALLTVSPAGEVTGYQGTSQEKLEIYTIVLEAWRAEKGAQQLWSIEEKALFRWLYGSDNAYVALTENDIPQEQAVEIALAALPEELSELTYSVTFDNYYKDASVRVWRFNVFGQGTEAYVIYVDAGDGEVLEIFPVSNFG